MRTMRFNGKVIRRDSSVYVQVPPTALSLPPGAHKGIVREVCSPTYEFAIRVAINGYGIFIRRSEIISVE